MIKEISYEQYQQFTKNKVLDFYTQCAEVSEIATLPIKYLGYFANQQLKVVSNYYTLKYKKIFKVAYFVQSEVFSQHLSQEDMMQYYEALKQYFKQQHYAYINVYPTMKIGQYNIDGTLTDSYINQQQLLSTVSAIYPQRQHFSIPNIMCIKSVTNLTTSTLMQGMSTNVKRLLKTSQKEGLKIKSVSVKELAKIYPVFLSSADRKNFDIFSLDKMTKILTTLPDNMYVEAVYVERQQKLAQLQQQLIQLEDDKKRHILQQQIDFLNQCSDDHVVLGAGLFYRNHEQIFYQMGGSYQLFNRWGTMIHLMYHQIEQAHQQGLKYYNFGGIFCHQIDSASFEEDSLYQFKRKFNSELLAYGHEFIIPLKQWMTKLINLK